MKTGTPPPPHHLKSLQWLIFFPWTHEVFEDFLVYSSMMTRNITVLSSCTVPNHTELYCIVHFNCTALYRTVPGEFNQITFFFFRLWYWEQFILEIILQVTLKKKLFYLPIFSLFSLSIQIKAFRGLSFLTFLLLINHRKINAIKNSILKYKNKQKCVVNLHQENINPWRHVRSHT